MSNPATESKPDPTGPATPMAASSKFPAWLVAAVLALVTIVLYWPATSHEFVSLDDPDYVTSNVHVQNGLTAESVNWAFFNIVNGNWHPVTMLSHELDCQLFGAKPWGHHLTNVLLHAANTVLVFLLLRRMTGAMWRSALVAALFGWHPLHVESVAWIAERKDVLSTFFGLLTLFCYAKAVTSDKWQVTSKKTVASDEWRVTSKGQNLSRSLSRSFSYWMALIFFALGLMSKPMLVTWPFVMLLLDYWPLQRVTGDEWQMTSLLKLVWEKIPFFALAAAASAVTFSVQAQGGAMEAGENLPLGARVGNALVSYCRYLGKTFWPTDLAVFYTHPGYWPSEQVLLAGAFLIGVSTIFFMQWRRFPFLLMGWLWFLGTLVPVIGLVQVGGQAMADRYIYIPSVGVLIIIVWGAYDFVRQWRYHKIMLAAAGLAVSVLCLAVTRRQLGYWQDSETLFRHTLAVTKTNYIAHNMYGSYLAMKGRIGEAISQYQEALRLHPDFPYARNNLGTAFGEKGQTDEAMIQFQEAIRLKPDYADAHYNLGLAFLNKGQADEAMIQFQEAARLKPDYSSTYANLGNIFDLNNQAWALATSPDAKLRDGARAVQLAERACELTHYEQTIMVGTLAAAYAEAGRFDEAVATGQKACALAEKNGETNLLKNNQELVKLYQAHQPYHEPAAKADGSQLH